MSNFEVYPIGRIQNNKNGTAVVIERKYIPAMAALEGFSHISIIWWFSDFGSRADPVRTRWGTGCSDAVNRDFTFY